MRTSTLIHEERQIRQFMEFVLVREDYELAKPHPEPYLTGLKRFGATPEETLVVEDSSRGLSSAVAAGIDCAVVHNDFTQAQDFSRASHRIDTLSELKDISSPDDLPWGHDRGTALPAQARRGDAVAVLSPGAAFRRSSPGPTSWGSSRCRRRTVSRSSSTPRPDTRAPAERARDVMAAFA